MKKDDASTYYLDPYSYDNFSANQFFRARGYVHKGGNEIECNLTGKYVFMVSNMSEEAGNGYGFSICSVGIFGESCPGCVVETEEGLTAYVR